MMLALISKFIQGKWIVSNIIFHKFKNIFPSWIAHTNYTDLFELTFLNYTEMTMNKIFKVP